MTRLGLRLSQAAPLGVLLALCASGCVPPGAPRTTRLVPPPAGAKLEPGPPAGVYWLRFKSAVIPPRTTGGLGWDDDNGLPDPVAVLTVDGKEALRTPTDDDTLQPAWQDAPRGNFRLAAGTSAHVDLNDYDGLTSQHIGDGDLVLQPSDAVAGGGSVDVDLGRGAHLTLAVEPARALYGLGFDFKFQDRTCYVTSLFAFGPGARAGMRAGDKIVAIGDKQVSEMRSDELRAHFTAVPPGGLALTMLHDGGTTETIQVAEGPVYPLFSEFGRVD